jgi:hypothetical protein
MRSEPVQLVLTTDATCVDLRATFGHQFQFEIDEPDASQPPQSPTTAAAWLTYVPCRYGRIYAFGGSSLYAYSTSTRRRRALKALPEVMTVWGALGRRGPGPYEVVVLDVADIEPVAMVLGARRRSRLSPPQTVEGFGTETAPA